MSYHDGFQQEGFEMVQNTERLTEGLSRLQEAYSDIKLRLAREQIEDSQARLLLQNEAEFTSYSLIANDATRGAQLVHSINFSSPLFTADDVALMKEAFKIHRVIISADFNQFFKMISAKRTNFMFACVMLTRLQEMRLQAISNITFAYAKKLPSLS